MGKRVEKVVRGWRVEVTVVERKETRDVDSYDDKLLGVRDEQIEHVVMSVTADNKEAAINKAIRQLQVEMESPSGRTASAE
jgi:CobQ-like glutamine amidotransferase family enzyme